MTPRPPLRIARDTLALAVVTVALLELTLRVLVATDLLGHRLPLTAALRPPGFIDGWRAVAGDPLFRRSPDPILEYELVPGARRGHLRINSLGLRGEEVPPRPGEGVTRIAVLGDSETFGGHLLEAETFTRQLQRRLGEVAEGRAFEVLNGGVPGYNTIQEQRLLERTLLPLEPDLVLLRYSFNDPALGASHLLVDRPWLARSHLYLAWRLLRRPVTPLEEMWAHHQGDWAGFFLALHRSPYFAEVRARLLAMAAELEARGIPFVLLVEPEISAGLHHDYPYDEIHRALAELGAGRFPVLDALGPLRAACSDPRELWHSPTDPHKNAAANRVLGRFAGDGLIPILEADDRGR